MVYYLQTQQYVANKKGNCHKSGGNKMNNISLKTLYVDIYSPATPSANIDSDDESLSDSSEEAEESEDPLLLKPPLRAPQCRMRPPVALFTNISTNHPGRPLNSNSFKFSYQPKSVVATILEKERANNKNREFCKVAESQAISNIEKSTNLNAPHFSDWTQTVTDVKERCNVVETDFFSNSTTINQKIKDEPIEDDLSDRFDNYSPKNKERTLFKCNRPNCTFTADSKKDINCHKRKVHRNCKDYHCDQCPYKSFTGSDLRKHYRAHSGELPYACPYEGCDYKGKHSNNLDYHKRKKHPEGEPLRCDHKGCDYHTRFPPSLKIHTIKKHSGEKSIACDLCPYRCHLVGELRKHSLSHSLATPYACDYPGCGYACKISSNLRKHKRIHTEERPYACELCAFRSNFVSSLKAHRRIHTNERPYCCDQCGYRCNSASNLKKHMTQRHPGTFYSLGKKRVKIDPRQQVNPYASKLLPIMSGQVGAGTLSCNTLNQPLVMSNLYQIPVVTTHVEQSTWTVHI